MTAGIGYAHTVRAIDLREMIFFPMKSYWNGRASFSIAQTYRRTKILQQ